MGTEQPSFLQIEAERMREIGHLTIDALVDQLGASEAQPVVRETSVEDLRRRLGAPPSDRAHPVRGSPPACAHQRDAVQGQAGRRRVHGLRPRLHHLAQRDGRSHRQRLEPGQLLVGRRSRHDAAGAHGARVVRGVARLPRGLLRRADQRRLGREPDGARLRARGPRGRDADDRVVYVSDQSHSSLARAARALGFRPEGRCGCVPGDRRRCASTPRAWPPPTPTAPPAAPALAVCASAGSTNTGAVDPLPAWPRSAPSTACGSTWTAPTAGSRCAARARTARPAGIERADSVTLDPHKWLFQPFECGALLVREALTGCGRAFEILPDYLRDAPTAGRGQLLRPVRPAAQALAARSRSGCRSRRSASTRSGTPSTTRSTSLRRQRPGSGRSAELDTARPGELRVVGCAAFRRA